MEFFDAINWYVLAALITVGSLVLYLRYIAPKIEKRDELYQQVILGLSIAGAIYDDEVVKKITTIIKKIIIELQELGEDVNKDLILDSSRDITKTLNIELEEEILEIIVDTMVHYLD
ncbi:hypothetical protein [Vallitalea okinawensis]|uniref:hypothetical protein n=1 Tax=Vallitalea okinawensis TaxID=2078660 RepID=UPI000CFC9568|nr:hypothetical protein [Vallitalea okinawensis]